MSLTTAFHENFGEGDRCDLTRLTVLTVVSVRWQTVLFSKPRPAEKAAKQLNQWRQKSRTLLDESQLDALLDKLSGYANRKSAF